MLIDVTNALDEEVEEGIVDVTTLKEDENRVDDTVVLLTSLVPTIDDVLASFTTALEVEVGFRSAGRKFNNE